MGEGVGKLSSYFINRRGGGGTSILFVCVLVLYFRLIEYVNFKFVLTFIV